MTQKKVALVILDGWGIGKKDSSDAIFSAKTPFIDSLKTQHVFVPLGANVTIFDRHRYIDCFVQCNECHGLSFRVKIC